MLNDRYEGYCVLLLLRCACLSGRLSASVSQKSCAQTSRQHEGYCVELADKICREYLNVDYEIRLVADGKYGEKMPNGTWNGMVGELTNRVRAVSYLVQEAQLSPRDRAMRRVS